MEPLFYAKIELKSHFIKKNNKAIAFNRKTGRSFIKSSPKAIAGESYLTYHLSLLKRQFKQAFPITEPISVSFIFHYKKNKNGKPTKQVADLSNLIQGPEDALQKAGVILNDKQIESFDGTRRHYDSDKTLLEIIILPFGKK